MDEWNAQRNARLQHLVDTGRAHNIDSTAQSEAPPPPRGESPPPKPSTNAEWISGYWHRDVGWAWIAGFWRVPEADIVADRTVHAPSAPPALRAEPTGQSPTAVAVWTPGFWSWDGRGYVWVGGAWRIPPPSARWVAPSWRPHPAGVVFVPGGWLIGRR